MLWIVLAVIVFLALSGLMAAVDAAVLSVSRPEIEVLIQEKKWGSRRLGQVKKEISQSVVVIVILTNTINVLGPILVSRQAFDLYGAESIVAITAVLALGTIVFSEIVPKALGAHYAPLIARISAPAILIGRYLMYPLVVGFAWLSKQFTKGTRHIGTEDQIRSLVRIGHLAGYIQSDEGQLIHRAFVLNDTTAGEIMTPLNRVKALGAVFTIKQAAAEVCRSEYSRYPVFGQSTDDIQGIVLSRDVLKATLDRSSDPLSSITRSAVIVDAQIKSDKLLTLFRDQHVHLAIVQDVGKTVGVVTLEDVLEELVGEIEDEKDVAVPS
jgi:putative hemolysin